MLLYLWSALFIFAIRFLYKMISDNILNQHPLRMYLHLKICLGVKILLLKKRRGNRPVCFSLGTIVNWLWESLNKHIFFLCHILLWSLFKIKWIYLDFCSWKFRGFPKLPSDSLIHRTHWKLLYSRLWFITLKDIY